VRKLRSLSWAVVFASVELFAPPGLFSAETSTPAPLVHYTFDEAAARILNHGTLGAEAELRMYDGIGVNAALLTDAGSGVRGRALAVGATHGDFGSFAHALPISFEITQAFTVTGWLKRDALKGGNLVANVHEGKGFNLGLSATDRLVLTVSGEAVASDSGRFEADAWIFFAAVWETGAEGRAVATLYQGGASRREQVKIIGTGPSGAPFSNPSRAFIVGNSANKDAPFFGLIDEIRIYAEALSVDRIEALRNSFSHD
jgi:hypothetical protein